MSEDSTTRNCPGTRSTSLRRAPRSSAEGGKRLWQSLEELPDTKEYRDFLENEFPANADNE